MKNKIDQIELEFSDAEQVVEAQIQHDDEADVVINISAIW